MYTFQMTLYWLLLTQLRCIACIKSPCVALHLLQCHGASASLLFCLRNAFFHQLSVMCRGAERENTCLWLHVTTSCLLQSLPVTPHCLPLLRSQQYSLEHLCINFLLDYRSHAKDNLAWCGFKAGISLWCCSPLPALICTTLYSPMPDGRLKSIILPTEMCFPEHYIKPQSTMQEVWGSEQGHLLDGTVASPKSQAACWMTHVGRQFAMLGFLWRVLTNNSQKTINW